MNVAAWALPELIEAASRTGQNDCAQGIHARSRALLSDGEDAETSYRVSGMTLMMPPCATVAAAAAMVLNG